jgi:hypothetical protein
MGMTFALRRRSYSPKTSPLVGRPRPRGCRATEKRNEFPSPHGPCPQAEAGTLAYRMGAFASQQNGTLDFRDGSTSDISTALIHVRFTPESGHARCN